MSTLQIILHLVCHKPLKWDRDNQLCYNMLVQREKVNLIKWIDLQVNLVCLILFLQLYSTRVSDFIVDFKRLIMIRPVFFILGFTSVNTLLSSKPMVSADFFSYIYFKSALCVSVCVYIHVYINISSGFFPFSSFLPFWVVLIIGPLHLHKFGDKDFV